MRISRTTRSCTLHGKGLDLSCWSRFRQWLVASDSVIIEQSESLVQPWSTPPLPAEALALTGLGQMSTDLRLDPVSDECEAATRVTAGKVGDPAAQDRIDRCDQSAGRLRSSVTETVLEFAQQRRALLALWDA